MVLYMVCAVFFSIRLNRSVARTSTFFFHLHSFTSLRKIPNSTIPINTTNNIEIICSNHVTSTPPTQVPPLYLHYKSFCEFHFYSIPSSIINKFTKSNIYVLSSSVMERSVSFTSYSLLHCIAIGDLFDSAIGS